VARARPKPHVRHPRHGTSKPWRAGVHRQAYGEVTCRPSLRSGTRSWRPSKWRLAARLVDDVELTVQVVAEQPEEVFAVVEFDAEAFGFLAGGRGEARGGDDDSLGEFALRDGADDLPDGGDVDLVVRSVPLGLDGDAAADEGCLFTATRSMPPSARDRVRRTSSNSGIAWQSFTRSCSNSYPSKSRRFCTLSRPAAASSSSA